MVEVLVGKTQKSVVSADEKKCGFLRVSFRSFAEEDRLVENVLETNVASSA